MHFKVLVPVEIPEYEQNETLDAQIKRDIAEMRDWLKSDGKKRLHEKVRAQCMIEHLVGRSSAFGRAVYDAVTYVLDGADFYDWYAIGGRWPRAFLVPDDCAEYTLGDYDGTEEETRGPEGYRWVAAARKKDIAWDLMKNLAFDENKKAYERLKKIWEAKEIPEGANAHFTEGGIMALLSMEYVAGESIETFCARRGYPIGSKYQYITAGYLSCGEYFEYDTDWSELKTVEDADVRAASKTQWAQQLDAFIDSLDEETVLVGVDCHVYEVLENEYED